MIINTMHRENGTRTVVVADSGSYYAVDTADTFDEGPETMVFRCRKNGAVYSFRDLYVRRYADMESAMAGHEEIARNIEKYT